ncbi:MULTISPECIES: glutathione peroxidase [unclassified Bacillus (in: firmicutes)]|uniref:glutathione peroxidase n=1 Tax=unclassified Bacillus (in: firmicutes) TaxID=185979 RepID=UPI0008EDA49D|nr:MULTISPECIES: glutathione peroxidase [unclassified Bacillus (in: firmicutes)]SFB25736.1 glutathione peroxidase [Bacillus sp. UNCCL13]SFQ91817.1 glutathione peroxidase [Bacillus sp. cl95]
MSIYEYIVETIKGDEVSLNQYRGKVLLIVNTASKCGFTPQFEELQELYKSYESLGFEVLGFPSNQFMNQEPGNEEEILTFCQLNYGVTFPMFSKIDVNGKNAHPVFGFLAEEAPGLLGMKAIKWNFTKFLIDRDGNVVKRFAPTDKPSEMRKDIEKLL